MLFRVLLGTCLLSLSPCVAVAETPTSQLFNLLKQDSLDSVKVKTQASHTTFSGNPIISKTSSITLDFKADKSRFFYSLTERFSSGSASKLIVGYDGGKLFRLLGDTLFISSESLSDEPKVRGLLGPFTALELFFDKSQPSLAFPIGAIPLWKIDPSASSQSPFGSKLDVISFSNVADNHMMLNCESSISAKFTYEEKSTDRMSWSKYCKVDGGTLFLEYLSKNGSDHGLASKPFPDYSYVMRKNSTVVAITEVTTLEFSVNSITQNDSFSVDPSLARIIHDNDSGEVIQVSEQ